jgi:hypothetical protein
MLLTVDVDLEAFVSWPGRIPLSCLRLPRRPLTVLPLQFIRRGQIVAVGSGAEKGVFGAKVWRLYDSAAFVFGAAAWAIVAGPPPLYRFLLTLDTPAVRAALGVGTDAELDQVTLQAQLRWTDQAGNTYDTPPLIVELVNEVIDGAETMDPSTPAEDVLNWTFITALSGGTATDLDAQATAGIVAYGTLIAMTGVVDPLTGNPVNGGGLTVWEFVNDAAAVTAAGVLVPLDFNAETNPGAWVQKS